MLWLLLVALLCAGAEAMSGCTNLPVLYNGYPLVFGQRMVRVDSQMPTATIRLAYCAMNAQSVWWTTPANVTVMAGGNRQVLGRFYSASIPFNNLTNYQCFQTTLTFQNPRPNLAPSGDGGVFRLSVLDQYCGQFSTSVLLTSTAHKPVASTSGLAIPSSLTLGSNAQLKMTFCLPSGHLNFMSRVAWNLPNGVRMEAPAGSTNTFGRMQAYRYQDSAGGCVCPGLAFNPASCWAAVLNIAYVSQSDAGRYSFSAINYAGQLYKSFAMSVINPPASTSRPPMTTAKRPMTTRKPITTTPMGPPTTTTGGLFPTTTTTGGMPAPPCYAKAKSDVVFLVDMSTNEPSIPVDGFQKAISLIGGVANQSSFGYGPNTTQFSIATFSGTAIPWIYFDDFSAASTAVTGITGVGRFGFDGMSDVTKALNLTLNTYTIGHGFRPGVSHKLVLFLATKNTGNPTQFAQYLSKLKSNFNYVPYAIGWSTKADASGLQSFAGSAGRVMSVPDNTYSASTMAAFQNFINKIVCNII